MVRPNFLLLSSLPAITSAQYGTQNPCSGTLQPWVSNAARLPYVQSWCSSRYPVPTVTTTTTVTAPTSTFTSTLDAPTVVSTIGTVVVTLTAEPTTVAVLATTFETSVSVSTVLITTVITTSTTTTATTTTAVNPLDRKKRNLAPNGAAVFKDLQTQNEDFIERVCSCIATTPTQTVTVTATPIVTSVVNATTNVISPVNGTLFTTSTPTIISTSTITSTVVTGIATTLLTTETEVDVFTLTSTATTTLAPARVTCAPGVPYNELGAGGCSSNCYCDIDADRVNHYCDLFTGDGDGDSCAADSDCPPGTLCTDYYLNGSPFCVRYTVCSSNFTVGTKRLLERVAQVF